MPSDNLASRFDKDKHAGIHTSRDHFTGIRLDLVGSHGAQLVQFRIAVQIGTPELMRWVFVNNMASTAATFVLSVFPINRLTFLVTVRSCFACATLLKKWRGFRLAAQ
jgi:hypothetical protein